MNRKGQWSLAPAYDITFAYNSANKWLKSHQMSINGKTLEIHKDDLVKCGRTMDISTTKHNRIIDQVYHSVQNFEVIARNIGIKRKTIDLILNVRRAVSD